MKKLLISILIVLSSSFQAYADSTQSNQSTIQHLGDGYATIQDEASGLTQRNTVNMTGAGVSCVDNAGSTRTDCTIAGGGVTINTQVFSLDFPSTATASCSPLTATLTATGVVIIGVLYPTPATANTFFGSGCDQATNEDGFTGKTSTGGEIISLSFMNNTGGAVDPAAANFTVYYIVP